MALTLKTDPFGAGTTPTMCVAVDDDGTTIKDFASSLVTSTMQVGANVTKGSQTWDGNTRYYWVPGSGTTDADFVKFVTNLPQFTFASGNSRTVVWIGEAAGVSVRAFGNGSTDYLASQSLAGGGNTYPTMMMNSSEYTGGAVRPSAGNKVIFGFTMTHGSLMRYYYALDNAASMTTGTTSSYGGATVTYSLDYLNRRDDSATHQQDKTHAIIIFPAALSEANWDSLRDDWHTALFSSGASAVKGRNLLLGVG